VLSNLNTKTPSQETLVSNSHSVGGSDRADVVGGGDGTSDGTLLVSVLESLSTEEGGSSLRNLEDNGRLDVAGSLEGSNDGRGRGDVLIDIQFKD
jgi:hypothetical protein